MSRSRTVTAFQYDNTASGAGHAVSFGVIPGEWTPGEPMLASAFGLTDDQLRAAITEFNLPLEEVEVSRAKVRESVSDDAIRFLSEQDAPTPTVRAANVELETPDGPIPYMAPVPNHPPLQPLTAAMQAHASTLFEGGSIHDAADAAEEAAGENRSALGYARQQQAAAADQARVEEQVAESDYALEVVDEQPVTGGEA